MEGRGYHHGDLLAALLQAVGDQIRQGGVDSVSLREAARRAGVSHAAPAHTVGDKRGLLTAFAVQGQELLGAELRSSLDRAGSGAIDRLRALLVGYASFGVSHPEHFAVMSRLDSIDDRAPEHIRVAQPNFDLLLGQVERCQEAGWQPDEDALELSILLWSSVHGLVELWLGGFVVEQVKAGGIERLAGKLLPPRDPT